MARDNYERNQKSICKVVKEETDEDRKGRPMENKRGYPLINQSLSLPAGRQAFGRGL